MLIVNRPRRLRQNAIIRDMIAETHLTKDVLIYPYFVVPGSNVVKNISALPGVSHFSIDTLIKDIDLLINKGLNKVMLFGVGDEKSLDAHSSYQSESLVPEALRQLKKHFGEDLYIVTDVCVCSYTTHGHCGILHKDQVHNDTTVELITKMGLTHAQAGADMLAPSDMMDGRVKAIREMLDKHQFENVAIMSHATKFASSYYGPFREAADCAPNKGDRKAYQMDFRNPKEALKEAMLDANEGADILMVKPALAYLDIIKSLNDKLQLPIACYNVSGEYAMVKAAVANGWIDEQKVVLETMYAFVRAGASSITTYHAKDIVLNNWL